MSVRRSRIASIPLAVGLTLLSALIPAAGQVENIRCHTLPLEPANSYGGGSARVVSEVVDGVTVLVLLPPGYDTSGDRYPTVYLLQGGANHVDCFLGKTDLIEFTAAQPSDRQAIVSCRT